MCIDGEHVRRALIMLTAGLLGGVQWQMRGRFSQMRVWCLSCPAVMALLPWAAVAANMWCVCVCVVPSSPPLQAFLRPGVPLQPGLLPPGTQLSLPDAVRLRDRATILARQLYATPDGAGPAVADQQVGVMWCDVV